MGIDKIKDIYVTIQNSINTDGLWYPAISIYFSGCDKLDKCKNCHNPELQNRNTGFKTTSKDLIIDIEKSLIKWLEIYDTMSICYIGGEPMSKWNRESVLHISEYFKIKYNKSICNILYSWRYIEDLNKLERYTKYIDYGVLGDFKLEESDLSYIPSSNNQYIYDFYKKKKVSPIKKG